MKHTISVLVENHAGVLTRISNLFARRGFNIDSLAVGVTENPNFSRMTIVVDGDDYTVEQLEKQLNKQIDVVKVKTLLSTSLISRELTLVKVGCTPSDRHAIMDVCTILSAKIIDISKTTVTIEINDTGERIDTLLQLVRPYGIREVVRTGTIAIDQGDSTISANRK